MTITRTKKQLETTRAEYIKLLEKALRYFPSQAALAIALEVNHSTLIERCKTNGTVVKQEMLLAVKQLIVQAKDARRVANS